jgi:hypothetical protein
MTLGAFVAGAALLKDPDPLLFIEPLSVINLLGYPCCITTPKLAPVSPVI